MVKERRCTRTQEVDATFAPCPKVLASQDVQMKEGIKRLAGMQMTLEPSDRFMVLACDGVWDVLSNQEVVNFVNQRLDRNMTCTEVAQELLDRCLAPDPKETKGIGCDNMTATIVLLHF